MAGCFLGGAPKGRPKDAVRRPGKQKPDTPEGAEGLEARHSGARSGRAQR